MGLFNCLPELPVSYPVALGVIYLIWCIWEGIYRLWFHPIAKFPGPKIAGLTYWYEMYYDIYLGGQYGNRIKAMHDQYGPIIRISPAELHVSDPSFYQPLYAPSPTPTSPPLSQKRHKWSRYVRLTGLDQQSGFATVPHDLHRLRRQPLEPFFSPANVRKLQGLIVSKVDHLCRRLVEQQEKIEDEGVRIKLAFTCFTTDVVTEYAFGKSFDYLAHPDFFPEWSDMLRDIGKTVPLLKAWPWLLLILDSIPLWLAKRMGTGLEAAVITKIEGRKQILALKAASQKEDQNGELASEKDSHEKSHRTIFEEVLKSDLPEYEKSVSRLEGDAQAILNAGSETTASVLGVTTCHILLNPSIHTRLRDAVRSLAPASTPSVIPSLQDLERCPYLVAVVKEGLRLSYGLTTRLPRIADVELEYEGWRIPAGTPVGMSAAMMHNDEGVWDRPGEFCPERWEDPKEAARLGRYLVSFSKGSRGCVGVNLAYAELYIALAALFRRFDMRLDGVEKDDLKLVGDCFLPIFKKPNSEIKVFMEKAQ
ncbi:cytochrome P450 [Aulographum hederae CBS 113979]|uniref:Cytochrome P450 n=1 Tax=Aulographum hederae CBS 113979 TaxID=1176131 RepID=A0A6G1GRR5_9PEZI|nr:cytochrome P450 [Aulographum hederae CBS 113979]